MGGKAQSPSPKGLGSTCFVGRFSTSSLLPSQGEFGLPDTVFPGWQDQIMWGPRRARNRLAAVKDWQKVSKASRHPTLPKPGARTSETRKEAECELWGGGVWQDTSLHGPEHTHPFLG